MPAARRRRRRPVRGLAPKLMDDAYFMELEGGWRKSLPRLADKELLEVYPEAKAVIPEKIAEWGQVRGASLGSIKKKLMLIKHRDLDDFSHWFWRRWVMVTDGAELLKAEGHIARLKRLLAVSEGRKTKGGLLTEAQIRQARDVPIENLISQSLRRSGKALVGLCPLHNERSPSFYIYPDTNRWWCYGGCARGGDVINFVELLRNCSFREAVQYLVGK